MMLTLLTVGGVALSLAAAYVVTAKAKDVVLASDNTVVGLSDPAADTLATGCQLRPVTLSEWNLATVTALSDAEELLDVLECQGYAERELMVLGNSCFTVRWR
ncbi:hypothetical protein R5W23_002595 [Gemmata sp. JC673]|uniref:Uncharacterized protein n=1 Tax=Gemmata algarum TaxID=2975278 RepID=A0ABU5F159_9BACT|nr:hypothetical protein [Gemmata algarum]MDY3561318.1 hypothetical protein [Gemmata algarum]